MRNAFHWEREEVFQSGDAYFSRMLDEIRSAKRSVSLESYIFEHDAFGKRVLEMLAEAASRGVMVRLLVDGIGAPGFNARKLEELDARRIFARIYHPLPWNSPMWRAFWKLGRLRKAFSSLVRLNRRDHRKLCLIDGRAAWVGSMNISAVHLHEFSGDRTWSDIGVRVEGSAVSEMTRAFDLAWIRAKGVQRKRGRYYWKRWIRSFRRSMRRGRRHRSGLVRLNSTRFARRQQHLNLIRRIFRAEKQVWITNAYFAPDALFLRALRSAAWTGADVRLLVPLRSDIFFMPWVARAFYSTLLRAGVKIYEYRPRILHAKSLIVDGWASVGSSNLNHRSILHDLETDVVLNQPESIQALEQQFQEKISQSREVTLETWTGLPLFTRVIGRILLCFRYWL